MTFLERTAIKNNIISKEEQEKADYIKLILYLNKNKIFTLSKEEKQKYENELNGYVNKLAAAG